MRKSGKEETKMKAFNAPVIEIEKFEMVDVITASGDLDDTLPPDRP